MSLYIIVTDSNCNLVGLLILRDQSPVLRHFWVKAKGMEKVGKKLRSGEAGTVKDYSLHSNLKLMTMPTRQCPTFQKI